MAQKPISANSEVTLDRHDDRTRAITIDNIFRGYIPNDVAQLIRVFGSELDNLRVGVSELQKENGNLTAQLDATKRELAAMRDDILGALDEWEYEVIPVANVRNIVKNCFMNIATSPSAQATQEGGA